MILKIKVRFCIFSVEASKNCLTKTTHAVCGDMTVLLLTSLVLVFAILLNSTQDQSASLASFCPSKAAPLPLFLRTPVPTAAVKNCFSSHSSGFNMKVTR